MSDLITKCEVCRALLDEEDLFCANCGTEAPVSSAEQSEIGTRFSTHNFQCQGCGASMSYDPDVGALRCPFCGSTNLQEQPNLKITAPKKVVPFQITKDKAIERMRQWLGQGFWRPGDLSERAMVVSMTPVYVPYWVFTANTFTYWTAQSDKPPTYSRAGWYPMSGEYQGSYDGILVGASGVLTSAETTRICPFDMSRGVPPEEVDLEHVSVEQFSVPRKYARPLARSGLESLEAEACTKFVPGKCRSMKVNVRISDLSSKPVLLPVWVMAYRYQNKVFRYLMNGQTGRSHGTAPTSPYKVAGAVVGGAILIGLLLLIGSCAMSR